jgi:hypothetical protein
MYGNTQLTEVTPGGLLLLKQESSSENRKSFRVPALVEEESDSDFSDDDLDEYQNVVDGLALRLHRAQPEGTTYEQTLQEIDYVNFVEPDVNGDVLASFKK